MIGFSFATLFSGGGGADLGFMAAGGWPAWAVEYDAEIAQVYQENIGDHVIVSDVGLVDYSALPAVDLLHASPVCTRASVANTAGKESDLDTGAAAAVARALADLRPRWFTLENVYQYREFSAFRLILAALDDLGYIWDFSSVNSADYGIPQTRRRLILRASRGLLRDMPGRTGPVGWFSAVADLVDDLPDSKLAPWQSARLPADLSGPVAFGNHPHTVSGARSFVPHGEHGFAVSSQYLGRARAVLIDGNNTSGPGRSGGMVFVDQDQPSFTIAGARSAIHRGIISGRVVGMTPRALARFQSFPDSYVLPEKRTLAAKVIGNAAPPLLMRRVAESVIDL